MQEHRRPAPFGQPAAWIGSRWLTDHAAERSAQRNLSEGDLDYVLQYGSWTRTAQADHVMLRARDIPDADRGNARLARLNGTVIVLGDGRAITVYRNRKASRAIRKKSKWELPQVR